MAPSLPPSRALLLALALPAALAPAPGRAQERRYTLGDYDVAVAVQPDGGYRVTERITYDFRRGTFHYITRDIPLRYIRDFQLVSLTSPATAVQNVAVARSRVRARIRADFAPARGQLPFMLTYDARGALFENAGRNIVDWDAIGRDWRVPIAAVHVAVLLPGALELDSTDITPQPSGATLTRMEDGGWRVDFRYGALAPRTAYRVVVAFPWRVPARTDWPTLRREHPGPELNPPLPTSYIWMLPLAALAGLLPGLTLFRLWGGQRRELLPGVSPPAPMPRAAAILPEWSGAPQRVFAAVLFDLAARGHLELRRVLRVGRLSRTRRLEVTVHDEVDDPLTDFERGLLDELRRHATLEQFARKGWAYRRRATAALRGELLREGLLEAHTARSLLLALGRIAAFVLAMFILATGGRSLLPAGIFLLASTLGLMLASLRVRTPTERGAYLRAQVLAYLAGLRQRVEALAASPVQAAEAYIADLPWLTLDTRVTRNWVGRILRGLKDSDGELRAPGWAQDVADETGTANTAYAAFLPYYHVTTAAAGTAAPGSGAAGTSAGAGAGGGAGGGGGGAG